MKIKRRLILIVSLFVILIAGTVVVLATQGGEVRTRNAIDRFVRRVEQDNLDDVILVIYYMNPFTLTRVPVSIREMTGGWYDIRIEVESNALREYIDLLEQISSDILISDSSQPTMDARIYYIFETTNGRRLFDVGMWMTSYDVGGNVLINGNMFEWNDTFADIIMPFLPDFEAQMLQDYLNFEGN